MRSVPSPELRPLQQPLRREDLKAPRAWLRANRQATDMPGVGLAIAGWVILVLGSLILLVALTGGADDDPAMTVVSSLMVGIGVWLLIWRRLRRRNALRRAARMLPFAVANGFSYAQRARLGPKAAPLLREGFDQVARDVLRADDSAEWGVWRDRLDPRSGSERLRGYLEVPWSAPPEAPGSLPRGLESELGYAPIPLAAQAAQGRLSIVADRPWRVEDPAVQVLVHRIRSLVAAQEPGGAATPGSALSTPMPMPAAIDSTEAGRRQGRAALVAGLATAVAVAGAAFLMAMMRTQL